MVVGAGRWVQWLLLGLLALVSLAVGVLFVLPVGGADVPIVISLLNAFTGLTVAASGYVLDNTLLLVAGTLVGASGTILTRLMAAAMGRASPASCSARSAGHHAARPGRRDRPVRSGSPEDVAILLGYARKVVVVPGYGLAVAQAQHTIRELAELLEARGRRGALRHPSGRRPDARAHERAAGRGERAVRGAEGDGRGQPGVQDRRRGPGGRRERRGEPGRQDDPERPIYGMPIMEVEEAKQVVFLKRSMRPGFAGIENELLYDPKTTLLFGDAKESLTKVAAVAQGL